ncbi:hypothetical protein [Alkalihalobacillus sp. TS-13]|uniref:hypothetical protein n=1 Tax=Alkalihalobacillus sp. TS-13 TaxID=2842455 RepID=UPI001C86AA07|nr:hypothetical protein [Alkalihalobacillus sp. TS-13]
MNNTKLLAYTILGNISIAVLAFIGIAHFIHTGKYIMMIGILFSLWFVMDYIKELQKKANIDKKINRVGYISYTIAALVGVVVLLINTDLLK